MNTASRYDGCEFLTDGTREYLGLRVPLDIAPRPEDRVDLLAHRYSETRASGGSSQTAMQSTYR